MTESEWLSSQDPGWMLDHLNYVNYEEPSYGGTTTQSRHPPLASNRKLRLFAVACLATRHGQDWEHLDDFYHLAEKGAFKSDAHALNAHEHALSWGNDHGEPSLAYRADLLRDIIGNPFRPVSCPLMGRPHLMGETAVALAREIYGGEETCGRCDGDGEAHGSDRPFEWSGPGSYPGPCPVCHGTGKVTRPFNAALMPILADALEDAGCTDAEVLNHLRGLRRCPRCAPLNHGEGIIGCGDMLRKETGLFCNGGWVRNDAPHVRGCFVIDLLLGRE
jgi:hypothetical protein